MRRLYFIRHAESLANKQRILGSRLPVPLTEAGLADARRIAGEFKAMAGISGIMSSPLRRAMETAGAFSEVFGHKVIPDDRLMEQDLGPFNGMAYDVARNMKAFESETCKRWDWYPGGSGESYAMVAGRVIDFLNYINRISGSSGEGPLLIVTHAVFFRLLRAVLENTLPKYPEKFPNNGEIWQVDFTGVGNFHEIKSIMLGNSRHFIHKP